MKSKEHTSSIINISSISGLIGDDAAAYGVSKAGVRALTKCAAMECGRKGYDIRVNTIFPGTMNGGFGLMTKSHKSTENVPKTKASHQNRPIMLLILSLDACNLACVITALA